MGYVEKTLSEGEKVVCSGRFHWFYTFGAVVRCLVAGAVVGFAVNVVGGWAWASGEAPSGYFWGAAAALLVFLLTMVEKWTTEIAITNRRLVYKRGWIARSTEEIRLSRIEEVNISQSVAGRIFGYGKVLCKGVGVGDVDLPSIAAPLDFRRALQNAGVGESGASPS